MESNFTRIEDVTRLQVGDLIVIPTEKDKKKKRLHVAMSTYQKMGVSIGDTCRSANTPEYVSRVLAKDSGSARAIYVSSVFAGYNSDRQNNMMRFLGNSINEKPLLPVIESAKLNVLPYEGAFDKHTMLLYLNRLIEHAKEMMADRLTKNLFFCNRNNGTHVEDECLALVYDSDYGRAEFKRRMIQDDVPCTNRHHPDAPMTVEERETFMSTSSIFDVNKCNELKYSSSWRNCHGEVLVTRKFFPEFSKRGALFYRPSEAFIRTVIAGVLESAFEEYEKRCLDILASATFFMTNFKFDIENTKTKIKQAKALRAELAKEAGNKDILKQFKEVMQWD